MTMMTEQQLLDELGRLPRSIEPERDLWDGIASRLEDQTPLVQPGYSRRSVGWAVAATLLVGIAFGFSVDRFTESSVDMAPMAQDMSVPGLSFAGMQQEYAGAIAEWRGQSPDQNLPLAAVEQLEAELDQLQEAVDNLAASMEADPNSPHLARMWRNVQQRQIDVMRILHGHPGFAETSTTEPSTRSL